MSHLTQRKAHKPAREAVLRTKYLVQSTLINHMFNAVDKVMKVNIAQKNEHRATNIELY